MTRGARFDPGVRKTVRVTLFTAGAIIILIGALGVLNRAFNTPSLPTILGAGLILSGLNYLVPYVSLVLMKEEFRPKWFMVCAAADAGFGVIFLARVGRLLFSYPTLIGLWIIFAACSRLFMAFSNFRAGVPKWWATLAVAGYMFFAAAAMMSNSSAEVGVFGWNALIVSGVLVIGEGKALFSA
jgi:uncharacterized membrane protein HdeD (DUF308 family)